jgi:hypothetical protein
VVSQIVTTILEEPDTSTFWVKPQAKHRKKNGIHTKKRTNTGAVVEQIAVRRRG